MSPLAGMVLGSMLEVIGIAFFAYMFAFTAFGPRTPELSERLAKLFSSGFIAGTVVCLLLMAGGIGLTIWSLVRSFRRDGDKPG